MSTIKSKITEEEYADPAVVKVVETRSQHAAGVSVDTPEDLARVERLVKEM
jgi:CMP-2-keto-3-deoxyoctulosonic acid synthetase